MLCKMVEIAKTSGNAERRNAIRSSEHEGKASHGEASQIKAMQGMERQCIERELTARQGSDVRRQHELVTSSGLVSNVFEQPSEMF